MSRTYRRTKDRKNRNSEAGMWGNSYEDSHNDWWIDFKYQGNVKVAKAHYHKDNRPGYYSPPKSFRKEYMIKPERRKTRDLLSKVKVLLEYDDAPLFPHHKKPKEYYW